MRRHLVLVAAWALCAPGLVQADWVFQPSYYTHSPSTGERVNQYARPAPAMAPVSNYQQSGYRHTTTVLRGPDSADRIHIVETWGQGDAIRPYGEWLYPYRAGATPYGPWGNPQGPWTLPYDSWVNPYGQWNRWPVYPEPYGPEPYGPHPHRPEPYGPHPYQPGPMPQEDLGAE